MADRQGLRLVKSGRRDPRAIDYGGHMLVSLETGGVVFGLGAINRPVASADDIWEYLTGGEHPTAA